MWPRGELVAGGVVVGGRGVRGEQITPREDEGKRHGAISARLYFYCGEMSRGAECLHWIENRGLF